MKKSIQALWDRICDPKLKLPLGITVVCLSLVLAGLVLFSRRGAYTDLPARIVIAEVGEAGDTETIAWTDASAEPLPGTDFSGAVERELPGSGAAESVVALPEAEEQRFGWQLEDGKQFFLLADGSRAVGLQKIDGRLYYFDKDGVKARSVGIDVSYYDLDIDWRLVKEQGIDFAIIRVGGRGWTSGALYRDTRTRQYLYLAKEAGLKIGVYFYSTAVTPEEAVEEADATLRALDGLSLDLPVFIDMEYSGQYPKGRADRLGADERGEIATAFCKRIRQNGYRAGVYAGQNYMKSAIDYYAISRYTVWLASYTVNNQLPNFQKNYDIWQFSDRGRVDGIAGDVDMNVIF